MKRGEGIEFWKRHLEGWRGSGLTQEAYCREQGVNFRTFARWRNRINRERKGSGVTATGFIPVAIKPPRVVQQTLARQSWQPPSCGRIELRFANGRTMVVIDAVDESQLGRLIRLVETRPC